MGDIRNNENEMSSEVKLTITDEAITYLSETQKWANFLSIVGFVIIGLIVIGGFFASTIFSLIPNGQMNNLPQEVGLLIGGIYVLIGLLYFFPTLYLFKFSSKLKTALLNKDQEVLHEAFSNQKSFYKFIGIFTIIVFSLYLLLAVIPLLITLIK